MVDWVEWEDRQADEYRMRRGYGGVRGERDRMGEGGGRYRPSESTPRYRRRGDGQDHYRSATNFLYVALDNLSYSMGMSVPGYGNENSYDYDPLKVA